MEKCVCYYEMKVSFLIGVMQVMTTIVECKEQCLIKSLIIKKTKKNIDKYTYTLYPTFLVWDLITLPSPSLGVGGVGVRESSEKSGDPLQPFVGVGAPRAP